MNHKLNDSLKHTNCVHIFPNFFQIRFIIQVPTHLQLTRPLPAPPTIHRPHARNDSLYHRLDERRPNGSPAPTQGQQKTP